jgi:hypothetical protein
VITQVVTIAHDRVWRHWQESHVHARRMLGRCADYANIAAGRPCAGGLPIMHRPSPTITLDALTPPVFVGLPNIRPLHPATHGMGGLTWTISTVNGTEG